MVKGNITKMKFNRFVVFLIVIVDEGEVLACIRTADVHDKRMMYCKLWACPKYSDKLHGEILEKVLPANL